MSNLYNIDVDELSKLTVLLAKYRNRIMTDLKDAVHDQLDKQTISELEQKVEIIDECFKKARSDLFAKLI